MSFFIRSKAKSKPKVVGKNQKLKGKTDVEPTVRRGKRKFASANEEILSESDEDLQSGEEYSSSDEDTETVQEKRLRLAKEYIEQLKQKEEDEEDQQEFHTDPIAHRLKQDVLEKMGKLHKEVAQKICEPCDTDIEILRAHQLSVTCLVISHNDRFLFTASKDCTIIKWDFKTRAKLHTIHGKKKGSHGSEGLHTSHILCMAISTDSKFLVSGDANKLIQVWDPETCNHLSTLTGHRNKVTGLSFRKGSHDLFSASQDRTVKLWNLDEMAYVETLFGHVDMITAIDSLSRERAVTAGGRDSTIRVWKVVEESQLVFNAHAASIDCLALINEENVITGADDNSLCLWGVMKKKPLATVRNAHECLNDGGKENWITAVTALQHTDLVASGSKDGRVRLWQCGKDFKSLKPLFSVPVAGFVNGLKFSNDGSYLVAAVGQEHRLGRWWKLKNIKNSIHFIKLNRKT